MRLLVYLDRCETSIRAVVGPCEPSLRRDSFRTRTSGNQYCSGCHRVVLPTPRHLAIAHAHEPQDVGCSHFLAGRLVRTRFLHAETSGQVEYCSNRLQLLCRLGCAASSLEKVPGRNNRRSSPTYL